VLNIITGMKQIPKSLLLFYVLVLYIFLQFCWWAYLIITLNIDLSEAVLGTTDPEGELSKKLMMVIGEGSVFLILLFVGFYQVRKSFMREVAVAKQQRNFLLSITHELNSPLASIKLYLQTLQRRKLSPEKTEQVLESTLSEVDRQSKLVNNILMAARVDDSSYHLTLEEVNVSTLLRRICNQQAAHFSHEFDLSISPNLMLTTDMSAFESIVTNLIENARKYAPVQSVISIGLNKKRDGIELMVQDEGPGIPEPEKEAVFRKFYRIGNEETRKSKGTGLGLYLVRFFVNALGGTINVTNNGGARFTVYLPVRD
jgi:signal transduction histidine kinase